MPLRIAFDLDGTLADMHVVLHKEAQQLFGEPARGAQGADVERAAATTEAQAHAEVSRGLSLTSDQRRRLWQHVKTIEDFWHGLPETEAGIVARLASLSEDRRWEIIFLTTRPAVAGLTVQRQSQRWLEAHGFRLPSVFVVQRSRGKIAAALELDAVVDDHPDNCLDVAVDSQAVPILLWSPGAERLPSSGAKRLGVQIVKSISAALDLLIELDDAKVQPGVTGSLRRFFGRRTTA